MYQFPQRARSRQLLQSGRKLRNWADPAV